MKVLVIDGQGGGVGRVLVEQLKTARPDLEITAVGTNALATAAMLKAGAGAGATGENAVKYNCARTDVIAGPIGLIFPNSLLGEITVQMAAAVSCSDAHKVLIPHAKFHAKIVGLQEKPLSQYIAEAVDAICALG